MWVGLFSFLFLVICPTAMFVGLSMIRGAREMGIMNGMDAGSVLQFYGSMLGVIVTLLGVVVVNELDKAENRNKN